LQGYFPFFVREKLIRDLIVFNFHQSHQSLRAYIDEVFTAAEFLEYDATESVLVNRIVTNFHPEILAHAAFLDRPKSLKDLYALVNIIEEKQTVVREREAREALEKGKASDLRDFHPVGSRNSPGSRSPPKCWRCKQSGHFARNCPQRSSSSGNGTAPGGVTTPGRPF
jgi:hypothetical protein